MNFREEREKTSIDFATILVGLPEVERKKEREKEKGEEEEKQWMHSRFLDRLIGTTVTEGRAEVATGLGLLSRGFRLSGITSREELARG